MAGGGGEFIQGSIQKRNNIKTVCRCKVLLPVEFNLIEPVFLYQSTDNYRIRFAYTTYIGRRVNMCWRLICFLNEGDLTTAPLVAHY